MPFWTRFTLIIETMDFGLDYTRRTTHFDSRFCLKMPLTTYEDFMELSAKQLSDYLSVRGLSTSGKKSGINNSTNFCNYGAHIGYHRVN